MKQIRFRAWDTNTLKMIFEPEFINVGGNGYYQVFIEIESLWLGLEDGVFLMQFTGMKDKNDKEHFVLLIKIYFMETGTTLYEPLTDAEGIKLFFKVEALEGLMLSITDVLDEIVENSNPIKKQLLDSIKSYYAELKKH